MEHARKMVLVPNESVEQLQSALTNANNSILKTVQTPGTPMTRLDAEMNNILNSISGETEREKWARYSSVLQRYLHFKDAHSYDKVRDKRDNDDIQKNHYDEVDNNSVVDLGDNNESRRDEKEDRVDASIIESVPRKFRQKAAQLLRKLRVSGNVGWDSNGVLTIGGVRIHGANMIDLINDAMRNRKGSPPPGHVQFAVALRECFVPREYIGNNRVWKSVLDIGADGSHMIPPYHSSPDVTGSRFQTPRHDIGNIKQANSSQNEIASSSTETSAADESDSSISLQLFKRKTSTTKGETGTKKKKKIGASNSDITSWRRLSGKFSPIQKPK